MSFQSFSKLPPPATNRPKNLPTPQFISTLNSLCEDSENRYDSRNHVLTLSDINGFNASLKQKLNRSFQSFTKQLKFVGFRKHKEYVQAQQDQEQRIILKYYWRGKKEEYINKQLQFTEKHIIAIINKAAEFKNNLQERKNKLDLQFEKTIFWGMNRNASNNAVQQKFTDVIKNAKEAINYAHKQSGELAKDTQINLDNQISLLRLLTFRQNDLPEQ